MFFNDPGRRLVMEMSVVKKINVVPVLDGRVPAIFAMNVTMIFVIKRHALSSKIDRQK
jgi:hypothetical protein